MNIVDIEICLIEAALLILLVLQLVDIIIREIERIIHQR